MKVSSFTLLVPDNKSVIAEQIKLPHFYQYLHRHDEWQLTWVERGEGTLIAGNNMHAFNAGDVFLIGAKLPHHFKCNPEYYMSDESKFIKASSIYFNPKGALSGMFSLPELKRASLFLEKFKHGFKVPRHHTLMVVDKMKRVCRSDDMDTLFSFLKLMEVLQSLKDDVEPLCSDVYSSNVSENEGMRLSKILSYIMDNYNTQITLEDIARKAYMTPHAFCRYFKKHTGHTFISFLNEVRINDACKSLISGQKADCISGVAYKAGFNSITNFNRVFKNIIGQSPKAYLDRYKAHNELHFHQAGSKN